MSPGWYQQPSLFRTTGGVGSGSPVPPNPPRVFFFGINISGPQNQFPQFPSLAQLTYWAGRGIKNIRLPIGWSQPNSNFAGGISGIQPTAFGPLDTTSTLYGGLSYCGALDAVFANAASLGLSIVPDIHAFGCIFGTCPTGFPLGTPQLPVSALADVWAKIVSRYMNNPGFGGIDIMNEWVLDSTTIFNANQGVITAVRALGWTGPIYIEGANFTGTWNWVSGENSHPTGANSANLYQLTDPANNLIFMGHCYPDNDNSGSNFGWNLEIAKPGAAPPGTPTSHTIFETRLTNQFIPWLNQHSLRGNIGESGISADYLAVGGTLDSADWNITEQNGFDLCRTNAISVFLWGPGFPADYPYNPEPSNVSNPSVVDYSTAGIQAPQMVLIDKYTGYSGPQPIAYRISLPVTITSTANPEAPNVAVNPYCTVGSPSSNFLIYYGGLVPNTKHITLADFLMDGVTSAGGTFTPNPVPIPAGENAYVNFTYTASQEATIKIAATNDAGWIDPPVLGVSSIAADLYRALPLSAPSNVYSLFNDYSPNIGPALRLQRVTDGQQMDWYYNNVGNLPRADIQTWASAQNNIPIIKRYNTGPLAGSNDLTFSGATLPTLNLNNSAGYPEIVSVTGVRGDFITPITGQLSFSILARFNQTSANDFFRMDQITGPIYWSGIDVEIFNTAWIGGTAYGSPPTAVNLSNTTLNITNGTYGEYAFTYAANDSLKTYKNGSVTSTTSTVGSSFTGTAGPNNTLIVTGTTAAIHMTDAVFGSGAPIPTYFLSQNSGTAGRDGTYTMSGPMTSVAASLTSSYIPNPSFSAGNVHFHYFQFGSQNWNGSEQPFRWLNGIKLSDAQIAAFNTSDVTYYSTPLPDTLPPVPPTISGTFHAQGIYPGLYTARPFFNINIADGNSGTPTDSATITLSGATGVLAGAGLSGSGPYTIAAASAASITATLRGLAFTPTVNTIGNTTTFTLLVTSSAGSSSTDGNSSTVIATYVAETPLTPPVGTFTPVGGVTAKTAKGVNASGGENTTGTSPNIIGAPIYPKNFQLDYYASKGLSLLRFPVNQVTLYTTAFGLLNSTQITAVKAVIDHAFSVGMFVNLEPHNYGGTFDSRQPSTNGVGNVFVTPGTVGQDLFSDYSSRIATLFKNYPNVILGLMNEPAAAGVTAVQWRDGGVIPAITAIRAAGATQLITIPGIAFTGAHSWTASGSAAAFHAFTSDPLNNYLWEVHQYLDSDNSGNHPIATQNGSTVLNSDNFITWLIAESAQGFLGETGFAWDPWPGNPAATMQYLSGATPIVTNGITQGGNLFAYMTTNAAQMPSWTYWSGGDFPQAPNNGGYAYGIDPLIGSGAYVIPIVDQPQMAVLVANL